MLSVEAASVTIDGALILDQVSLSVAAGETMVVLGPSGSGKSTLLRLIAGLQTPTSGRVAWKGQDITATAPHLRGFGLMFQDLALFPHLDVHGNVGFGLADDEPAAIAETLALVGLSGFEHRQIDTLSGGEQQRVALARSLAPQPKLLMLDEPLGSLDRVLRERLTEDLGLIFAGLDSAVLYVTHDQHEALALADRLVILDGGRVIQAGHPEDIWRHPASEFVARFIGWVTFADAAVVDGWVVTPWGRLPADGADGPVRVGLAPGAAVVDRQGEYRGTVISSRFNGMDYAARIRPESGPDIEAASGQPLEAGGTVQWTVDSSAAVVF